MKKLFVLSVLVFATAICSAQMILEKSEDGDYRISDEKHWRKTGTTVEEGAQYFLGYFSQAIENPGEPILVRQSEKFLRLKPIFKKLVEEERKEIVYDDSEKTINLIEPKSSEPREEKSYAVLFAMISIIFMISSNVLSRYYYSVFFALVAAIFVLAFIFSFTLPAVAFFTGFFAFIAAILAVFFNLCTFINVKIANTKSKYKLLSKWYYLFIISSIILLFI